MVNLIYRQTTPTTSGEVWRDESVFSVIRSNKSRTKIEYGIRDLDSAIDMANHPLEEAA